VEKSGTQGPAALATRSIQVFAKSSVFGQTLFVFLKYRYHFIELCDGVVVLLSAFLHI